MSVYPDGLLTMNHSILETIQHPRVEQQIIFLHRANETGFSRRRELTRANNDAREKLATAEFELIATDREFRSLTQGIGIESSDWRSESYSTDRRVRLLGLVDEHERTRGLIARLQARCGAIQVEESRMESWHEPTGRLFENILKLLGVRHAEDIYPGGLPDLTENTPSVISGDTRRKNLDAIQKRIATLQGERATAIRSICPEDEFRAKIFAGVQNSEFERGVVGSLLRHEVLQSLNFREPLCLRDIAWLFGTEEIADQLVRATKASRTDQLTLSTVERNDRLGRLEDEIDELSRAEEREVLSLFDAGIYVCRRETANASILLDVWTQSGGVE